MSDYSTMCSMANLRRAYRWLQSNPDPRYKRWFHDSYAAYAISSDRNLKRLRTELRAHRYEAGHASKIFLPKPSGVLRPMTLLTVNDQVVYQACVNVVADKLKPVTKQRYRKRVFNHLYAGKSSIFFHLKWQDSYRMYSDNVRDSYNAGYRWVANFDLTSFYDSIDHNVLRYFLSEIKIESELTDYLMLCLKTWTSSTWNNRKNIIYHEHGIPQGPLSSGMLSEVVLKHIDEGGESLKSRRTRYIRYVDDIKIFAKKENHLRQKLIALDLSSKEVGLFPQTSKINIRQFSDPEDEIKSVSNPPEPSIGPKGSQSKLVKRLLVLTRRGTVANENSTRFKYLLGHVDPTFRLNARLLKVLERHPEFSETISRYFHRYPKLPDNAAQSILNILKGEERYHSAHGDLLRAVLGNVQQHHRSQFANFCYDRLFKIPRPQKWALEPQPTYKEALVAWVVSTGRITFVELENLNLNERDWWVRKSIFRTLEIGQFGRLSFENFANSCIFSDESELSRCAAAEIVNNRLKVRTPYGNANFAAKDCLKSAGLIRAVGRSTSLIATVLNYVIKLPIGTFNWQRFLGTRIHKDGENLSVFIKQGFESDIDACLVRLDSLCDLIFEKICSHFDPAFTYGTYGSSLNSPTATILASSPNVISGFKDLHELRKISHTSHPRSLRTGARTRRLKHSDFYVIRPKLLDAFKEMQNNITP
jgi:retron-type reverse transcriptase